MADVDDDEKTQRACSRIKDDLKQCYLDSDCVRKVLSFGIFCNHKLVLRIKAVYPLFPYPGAGR